MPPTTDPIDILHHIQLVEEILSYNEEFEEKYREYENSQKTLGTERRKRLPVLTISQSHPVIPKIYQARSEIDRYFRSGSLNIRPSVLEINKIGQLLHELSDIPLVKPDFSTVEASMKEIWGRRLWQEEDFWDAVYELEIAAFFLRNGFKTYLIEEGQKEGPDVIVLEDGNEVWVECKRKRPLSERERELGKVRASVADEVWDRIDISDDSFVIDLFADDFIDESHVDRIAGEIVELVNQQGGSRRIDMDGITINIDLVDYHEGSFTVEGPNIIQEVLSDSPEIESPLSPFPHLNYSLPNGRGGSGHIETLTEASNELRPELFNSMMYGYTIDVDYEFLVEWAMNAVESARSDLSGNPPAIAFVDIPYDKYEIMSNETTLDHRESRVTLLERFSQRIRGQLMDSSSLNGIVITTETRNYEGAFTQEEKSFSSFLNDNPNIPLPDLLSELLRGKS